MFKIIYYFVATALMVSFSLNLHARDQLEIKEDIDKVIYKVLSDTEKREFVDLKKAIDNVDIPYTKDGVLDVDAEDFFEKFDKMKSLKDSLDKIREKAKAKCQKACKIKEKEELDGLLSELENQKKKDAKEEQEIQKMLIDVDKLFENDDELKEKGDKLDKD